MRIPRYKGIKHLAGFISIALSVVCFIAAFILIVWSHSGSILASAGINQQMSFAGKIVKTDGTNIADGTYNVQFNIYCGGDGTSGTTTNNCNDSTQEQLLWTEDYLVSGSTGMPSFPGLPLTSGTFQVNLGSICALTGGTCGAKTNSAVDFNQDKLWLSIEIGGTTSCTVTSTTTSFHTACGPGGGNADGEMSPFIRLTTVPYAMNSLNLGGLAASSFVQLAQGTQTDSSTTNPSIAINKTGGTANVLTLQRNGTTVLGVDTNGTISSTSTSTNTKILNIDATGNNANNIVSNPSFEAASTTWASVGTTPSTIARTSGQFYNGANSLDVLTNAEANDGVKINTFTGSGYQTGTTYNLALYIKASVPMYTTLQIGYSDDGSIFTTCAASQTNYSTGWLRYLCSFKTAGSTNPFIYVRQTDNIARHIYVDAILMQTDANADSNYRDAKIQLGGPITNSLILQNASDSNTAFQIQNASGGQVFNVNTTDTNNIVFNPSFEVNMTSWATKGCGSNCTFSRDTTQQKYGLAAGKFVHQTTPAANDGATYTLPASLPATTYTISFEVKLSSGAFGSGTLVAGLVESGSDQNCTALSPAVTASVPGTNGWTRFTCSRAAGASPTALYIKQTDTVAHDYWVDAVQMEFGSTATPYGLGQISISGEVVTPLTLRNQSDSTLALQVTNAAATNTLLSVDTLNSQVLVGGVTAASGAVTGVSTISMSGVLTSTLSTGTAPFTIASTTQVNNLNVSQLQGATWAVPAAIGSTTPAAGTFTTVGVNTANGLTLGVASSASGGLIFKNSSNANTITIQTGATNTSTTIKLAATSPGATTQQGSSYLPFVTKLTADSASNATTTLADITASGNANDALSLTIPAGAVVNFRVSLIYVGTASSTIKTGWKCSNVSQASLANSWMTSTATVIANGGTTTACTTSAAAITTGGTTGLATPNFAEITGTITANAGSATTVTFEYADTTNGQACTVKAGSYITWWQ